MRQSGFHVVRRPACPTSSSPNCCVCVDMVKYVCDGDTNTQMKGEQEMLLYYWELNTLNWSRFSTFIRSSVVDDLIKLLFRHVGRLRGDAGWEEKKPRGPDHQDLSLQTSTILYLVHLWYQLQNLVYSALSHFKELNLLSVGKRL